jgi:hypothetical protein
MKKIVLFFVLFAAFAATQLRAQVSGFGFRPSVTLSTYKLGADLGDTYDAALRPGFGLAGFVEINLGNRFTIQPEIAFTQRGANLNSEAGLTWDGQDFGYPSGTIVTEYRLKETLNYIDVNAMFERNFGGGNFGAYLAAGPSLSFAVGNGKGLEVITAENEDGSGGTDTYKYAIEMGKGRNDVYSGVDLGLNLGGGLIYIMERGELGFDLRYTHGLRALDTEGLKNRSFQVGMSYMHYFGD